MQNMPDAFALVFLDLTTPAGVTALRGMAEKMPGAGFPQPARSMPDDEEPKLRRREAGVSVPMRNRAEPPATDIDA